MAIISLPEEIVNNYRTEDVLFWMEAELRTLKAMATKKEADKSFVLGQISIGVGEVADVMHALIKKLVPKSKEEPPVVAG